MRMGMLGVAVRLRRCLKPQNTTILSSYSYHSSPSNRQRKNENQVDSSFNRDPTSPPRLFVVQPRLRPDTLLQAKLNEALCLANSLEEQRDGYFDSDFFDKPLPPHILVQNPIFRSSKARADTYFGTGTVDDILCHIRAIESKDDVDAVFVNAILSGIQLRNLERKWNKPVLDRVSLIIEIFNAHAHTKEAKLQAELAALMYAKSRLVRVRGSDGRLTFGAFGDAEVVSARGRGSGGRGFTSGAGETELQLQRRRILERRETLLAQIKDVRRTRALQRASRKRHCQLDSQYLATVAVVGYTNAGKSTLVSALSGNDLYSDSRLFATLDARLKSVVLPSGRKVLLGDTVGFISDLPVQLVQAFRATLEEVVEADLLVHLMDSTAPNLEEHRATVLQALQQIGVSKEKLQNMIEVWNKIDYQEEMVADEYLCDGEDGEASSLSGVEGDDVADDEINGFSGRSEGDFEETPDNEQDDYSGDWLLSGDDQEMVGDHWLKTLDEQRDEALNDLGMQEVLQCQAQHGPHLKISAVTGVGLQELLELIDDRLKTQDEKFKEQNVVERGFFNKKWRPPRTEDAVIAAAEQ
ncbi:PREDICTED: GTP-binding protein At3g49725, chloroplastic [Populus euphratica]|uniref:GTP-binding protein At3g49725, chloroplastic n=1 Tax=Populus euphratica TaxID=75702 RepID=A0AAJ6UKY3_POPEU|nr:PREDICTED: GTP-binding protein At3g49725, chloroplastic [Populus euphratica]